MGFCKASLTKYVAGETLRRAALPTKPPRMLQPVSLKVNSHPWLRGMCIQLCFYVLTSLKALVENWGIYLLPKTIFFSPDANRMGVKPGRTLSPTIETVTLPSACVLKTISRPKDTSVYYPNMHINAHTQTQTLDVCAACEWPFCEMLPKTSSLQPCPNHQKPQRNC